LGKSDHGKEKGSGSVMWEKRFNKKTKPPSGAEKIEGKRRRKMGD